MRYHLQKALQRSVTSLTLALCLMIGLSAGAFAMGDDKTKTITITNLMTDELLAPVLIVPTRYDKKIFKQAYVSAEAEHQILTGDPAMLVEVIGKKSKVVHGTDGPPQVLLAPGKSVSIEVKARKGQNLRIIAMVAPTIYKDHFVTGIINVGAGIPLTLDRFDIGHDEGRKATEHLSSGAALVTIK